MERFEFGGKIVWRPTKELIAKSHLKRFMDRHSIGTFDGLMQRSTTDIAWFWGEVLKDLDIQFYKTYSKIVDLSKGIAWPHWCVDGEMNIVHNCLDRYEGTPVDQRNA
ncbi:MAG: acetyl-coenzyme A synthetase N-terminal domain-containing protein, partial [Gammaproteobacteria bacterium]